jgi:hypothetical protein
MSNRLWIRVGPLEVILHEHLCAMIHAEEQLHASVGELANGGEDGEDEGDRGDNVCEGDIPS